MEPRYIENDSQTHEFKLSKYSDYIHPKQECLIYDEYGREIHWGTFENIPKDYFDHRCVIHLPDPYLIVAGFSPDHLFSLKLEIMLHTKDA